MTYSLTSALCICAHPHSRIVCSAPAGLAKAEAEDEVLVAFARHHTAASYTEPDFGFSLDALSDPAPKPDALTRNATVPVAPAAMDTDN